MAETPGSSVHDWRGPVRADYLAVPMTTGVQRPHRTLLRPARGFVVTRQPLRVVAPTLRHAKDLSPAGRIAVRVSSAQRISNSVDDVPTGEVLGDGNAPLTRPTSQPSGSLFTTDDELTPDDDALTTSGVITPTLSSASASHASTPTPAKPLPRPSTSRPPRRRVSTGPVPLPPQGVTPARSARKPQDQVLPSRGNEPDESEVLPSVPPTDVLAAITVTEDGRTLTGRTRSMRRPSTQPQAQPSEHSSEPTRPHEHTRTPTETSNQAAAVNPSEPVEPAAASPLAGSSPAASATPAASSVPALQSDGIQRRPRSTRIRGSAPAATTAPIADAPSLQVNDSQQPSTDTSPATTPPSGSARDAPFTTSAASTPSPIPAVDAVQPTDVRPSRVQRHDGHVEDAQPRGDSDENPSTNTAPISHSPAKSLSTSTSATPPATEPFTQASTTPHPESEPVLADAPIQRRATSTPRVGDPDKRDAARDADGSPVTSSVTPSVTQTSTSTATDHPTQAATSDLPKDSSTSEQSQSGQHTPDSTGSPTTITVPADIRAAIVATTGVSPATASIVRGEAVSKQARDLEADAFTHRGQVHLPGTAPLTSDHQRRLLAHELTHVVQQGNGKRLPPEHTPEGQRLEQKALDVERILATASSHATPTPDVPASASPTPNGPSPMTPPLTSPVGGSTAAGVPVGGSPTKPAQVPGKRVDASSSSDLVRVVATPRSPVPPGRQQPRRNPEATPAPVDQSTPSQADVAQASGMQPVALPVVTSHIPATSSGNPMASSAPDSAVVQRRGAQAAPPSAPLPPTTAPPSATAANFSGIAGLGPEEYRRSPRTSEDATPDDAWLERHAAALYPIIRRHLRNELLRDRERRGRLVRED